MVRALYTAATVESARPPFATLHVKVFYPAAPSGDAAERMSGQVPVDAARAPLPVVIFFSGINLSAEAYQWLAVALAEGGAAVALFNWVGETLPGVIGLTAGLDIARVTPGGYGSGPTTPAVAAVLRALSDLNREGVLKGALDLDRVVLGGHSAGGTMALHNARRAYFPGVAAAFAYGGHTMAATMLGHAPGTILPVSGDMPMLIMGGGQDGVIAASSARYGLEADPVLPLRRTFDEAVAGGRGDRYLVVFPGANHFSIAHPLDETAGRAFLDWPGLGDAQSLRADIAACAADFIAAHARNDPAALGRMRAWLTRPGVEARAK